MGNRETSEIDVLDRLELDGWTSLVGFDAEAARERIETLPWIEVAAVRKVYPHALEVRVEERQPFAIWQQGRELSVIEKDGRVIAPYAGGKEAKLPLIIGVGAPERAPAQQLAVVARLQLRHHAADLARTDVEHGQHAGAPPRGIVLPAKPAHIFASGLRFMDLGFCFNAATRASIASGDSCTAS